MTPKSEDDKNETYTNIVESLVQKIVFNSWERMLNRIARVKFEDDDEWPTEDSDDETLLKTFANEMAREERGERVLDED